MGEKRAKVQKRDRERFSSSPSLQISFKIHPSNNLESDMKCENVDHRYLSKKKKAKVHKREREIIKPCV